MKIFSYLNHLRHFTHDPLKFMHTNHRQYGDLYSLYLGHKKFHFMSHPDHIQHVLNHHVDHYRKSRLIFDKIVPITGNEGLVQLEGEKWQDMRLLTNEIFHGKYLARYTDIINMYVDRLIYKISENAARPIDFSELMIEYSLSIALRLFLGLTHSDQLSEIAQRFIQLNHLCGLKMRQILVMPEWMPTANNTRIKKLKKELKMLIGALIDTANHKDELSLLGKLTAHLDRNKYKELIHDQIMTFTFAGYETTAASLAFCFYLLAESPDYQIKIREKNDLLFTQAVYRESLRLYPPAYMLAREVYKADRIANTELRCGDNVILPIFITHKHAAFWLDPDKFIPERFLKPNKLKHKFAFIPFGYGKSVCSGMSLAMLEANIVIQKIVNQFNLKLISDTTLPVEAMVTLHPKMIYLAAEKIS